MKQRTIAQAAMEVLQEAGKPMTAADIAQKILDKELYSFNTQDVVGMVRRAIVRRCEGYERKDAITPAFFVKETDATFYLK